MEQQDFNYFLEEYDNYVEKLQTKHIPVRYCAGSYKLGYIASEIRSGLVVITEEQKQELNNRGFLWRLHHKALTFEEIYELLLQYREEHGNLMVPRHCKLADGLDFGSLIGHLRNGTRKLEEEQKKRLDDIGFPWSVPKYDVSNEVFLQKLEEYYKIHGDVKLPPHYETEDGIPLRSIMDRIRLGRRTVTQEEREKLNAMHFSWKVRKRIFPFEDVYVHLLQYQKEYGNVDVPQMYKTPEGIPLGTIVQSIRSQNRKISPTEKKMLEKIGFRWKVREVSRWVPFPVLYQQLCQYREENGHLNIPYNYTTEEGIKLGVITLNIRYGNRQLTDEQKQMLTDLGFRWPQKRKKS